MSSHVNEHLKVTARRLPPGLASEKWEVIIEGTHAGRSFERFRTQALADAYGQGAILGASIYRDSVESSKEKR